MFPKIVDFSDVCAVSMNYHLRYCPPKHFLYLPQLVTLENFAQEPKQDLGQNNSHVGAGWEEKPIFNQIVTPGGRLLIGTGYKG